MPLDPELRAALTRLAKVPTLLVGSDYDGVLAPIVPDPSQAVPLPAAVAVLTGLTALPRTAVAVVSGRARDDLAALAGTPPAVTLVGSHGGEFANGFRIPLDPEQTDRRRRLEAALAELVRGWPGVALEAKPASVAVHTRAASREVAAEVFDLVCAGPATWPEVHLTTGKEVLELAVIAVHKGTAVDVLRGDLAADAVLFLGDDVTDENAFAHLRDQDLGVKVGPGETLAGFRVADPPEVVEVLEFLLAARRP